MKRRLLLTLQVTGTVVLVGVAVAALDLTAAAETLLATSPELAFVGFALLLVGQLVSALRWRELAAHAGVPGSPSWFGRVYLRGCFYNTVLPTGLGGDAVRVMLLRKVSSTRTATRSVVRDRLLGFAALAATAAFVVPFTAYLAIDALSVLALVSLVLIGVGLALLAFTRRIPGWIARTAGWTLAYEVIWFAGVWFLAAAVGIAIAPAALPVVVLIVGVALALPLSIGGTGAREGAFVLALTPLGIAAETAVALGVLFGLALAAVGLVGAVVPVDSKAPRNAQAPRKDLSHTELPVGLSPEVAR
jgi:uncharacterized membrane protein YbhN (UPF0104 family)